MKYKNRDLTANEIKVATEAGKVLKQSKDLLPKELRDLNELQLGLIVFEMFVDRDLDKGKPKGGRRTRTVDVFDNVSANIELKNLVKNSYLVNCSKMLVESFKKGNIDVNKLKQINYGFEIANNVSLHHGFLTDNPIIVNYIKSVAKDNGVDDLRALADQLLFGGNDLVGEGREEFNQAYNKFEAVRWKFNENDQEFQEAETEFNNIKTRLNDENLRKVNERVEKFNLITSNKALANLLKPSFMENENAKSIKQFGSITTIDKITVEGEEQNIISVKLLSFPQECKLNKLINNYYSTIKDIKKQNLTPKERELKTLDAIFSFVADVQNGHFFTDGNGRLSIALLNNLLNENELPLCVLENHSNVCFDYPLLKAIHEGDLNKALEMYYDSVNTMKEIIKEIGSLEKVQAKKEQVKPRFNNKIVPFKDNSEITWRDKNKAFFNNIATLRLVKSKQDRDDDLDVIVGCKKKKQVSFDDNPKIIFFDKNEAFPNDIGMLRLVKLEYKPRKVFDGINNCANEEKVFKKNAPYNFTNQENKKELVAPVNLNTNNSNKQPKKEFTNNKKEDVEKTPSCFDKLFNCFKKTQKSRLNIEEKNSNNLKYKTKVLENGVKMEI